MFERFRKQKNQSMNADDRSVALKKLSNAISDVGYWNWWTAEYPKVIMLEFGGVQLWSKPKKNQPPSGQLAIKFQKPISVSFVTREEYRNETPNNWADLLHEDKLEQPTFSHGCFGFNQPKITQQILEDAKRVETVFGINPTESSFGESPITFSFWAGNVGALIACESMEIVTHDGKLSLDQAIQKIDKWWEYWKVYWSKIDSKNPLPKDYACEVTIPAGTPVKIKNG